MNERFSIKESYVDGFGDCFQLVDNKDEFGEWYSLSERDLSHLVGFLNNQEKSLLYWKSGCCHYSNMYSILSMDCQIVFEAIWDLRNKLNEYDETGELEELLDDLESKFKVLQEHGLDNFKEMMEEGGEILDV